MMRSFANAVGLGALILSAGCSATSVPIHGSDGKPYVYVDCSGMFRTLDDCYRVANRVCPAGYRITNSVAPRANPFGNLVIDCQDPGSQSAMPLPTPDRRQLTAPDGGQVSGDQQAWCDALAALIAAAPDELRALASDELHIGGFTNVRLEHPVLDLRGVADDALAERAVVFFLAAALLRGAAVARVHVARGAVGSALAATVRKRLRPALERIDDESVALLRYFDVYLRAPDAIDARAGARLLRAVAPALAVA